VRRYSPVNTLGGSMTIHIPSFWPAIMVFVLITTVFCLPGKAFPTQEWFAKIFLDKWIHAGVFAVLVALWCLPLMHRRSACGRVRTLFMGITVGFLCYGMAIECVQGHWIPHRTLSVADIVADALGCGIGFLFANKQLKKQKTHRETLKPSPLYS